MTLGKYAVRGVLIGMLFLLLIFGAYWFWSNYSLQILPGDKGKNDAQMSVYVSDRTKGAVNITILPSKHVIFKVTPVVLEEVQVKIPLVAPKEVEVERVSSVKYSIISSESLINIEKAVVSGLPQGCLTLQSQEERDSCYSLLAVQYNDPSVCLSVKNHLHHDACLFAVGSKDCSVLINEQNKKACEALK